MGGSHSNPSSNSAIHRVYRTQLYSRFNKWSHHASSHAVNNTKTTEIDTIDDNTYNTSPTSDADNLSSQLGIKLKQYEELERIIRKKEAYDAMNVRSAISMHYVSQKEINAALEQLFIAIEANTVSTIEYLLLAYPELKPHLNATSTCYIANRTIFLTPLMLACISGFDITISLLLQVPNVDINAIEQETKSNALMFAVNAGQKISVKRLLEYDSLNINDTDANNYTALHLAILLEEVEIVKLICKRKDIDMYKQTATGDTALHLACRFVNADIVDIIFETVAKCSIQKSSLYSGNNLWKIVSPTVTSDGNSDNDSCLSNESKSDVSPHSYDAENCLSPRASIVKRKGLQHFVRIKNKNYETAYNIIEEAYNKLSCSSPSKHDLRTKTITIKERLRRLL